MIKSPDEMRKIAASCRFVVRALDVLEVTAQPGITTLELDTVARDMIAEVGVRSAFLGYHGFPATLCVSVNEEVAHGIPGPRVLAEGDLVSLDFGVFIDGWCGDCARTFAISTPSPEARDLNRATREAMLAGIAAARPGGRVGDIGRAIEDVATRNGYSIVRDFVGHGIGRRMHEEPQIPHWYAGPRERLVPGMCIAIEPMLSAGRPEVEVLADGWTAVMKDGSLSAHHEQTIGITEHGPLILSA